MKLKNIPDKFIKIILKLRILLLVVLAISYVFVYKMLETVDDKRYLLFVYPAFSVMLLLVTLYDFVKKRSFNNLPFLAYIYSGIVAVYSSYSFISFTELNVHVSSIERMITFVACSYLMFLGINAIVGIVYKSIFNYKVSVKQFVYALLSMFTICFVVFYYLPAESFFASFSDYAFPYQFMVKAFIVKLLFWSVVPALFMSIAKEKFFNTVYSVVVGLLLAIYVQYLFFNRNLGTLTGVKYNWTDDAILSIINLIVWALLIIGSIVVVIKKKNAVKGYMYVTAFVLLIHLSTYAVILLQADKQCFSYAASYFSFENQFNVGSDENIIVFVIDAADNRYLKNLYSQNDEIFDEYSDFTMYTNTCSVYDYTALSMLQMVTNLEFDNTLNNNERRAVAWNTPWATEFFDRLHNAGYKVEAFNLDDEKTMNVVGKLDNAFSFDPETDKPLYIGYKKIRKSVEQMTSFTVFPNVMKSLINMNKTSFAKAIVYRNQIECYGNDDFYNNLELAYGENDKYVLYQHIDGCHPPDDNEDTMKYCMEIVAEYIRQMKELGVYDKATIIVTADHGILDPSEKTGEDMEAATPILLIKKANETEGRMRLSSAPVYHRDIMPTILYAAGLYNPENEADVKLFGKTFFDFNEDEERERIWYDRVNDRNYDSVGVYNTYYGYTYTGDTEVLEQVVNEGVNVTIYPVPAHND